jgi:hypothetical protein
MKAEWVEILPTTKWELGTEIGYWLELWEGKPAKWLHYEWPEGFPNADGAYWLCMGYTHLRRLNPPKRRIRSERSESK